MSKEPLCLAVNYALSNEFAAKLRSQTQAKILKTIEIVNCQTIEYWIDCPIGSEDLITDYAFMTWIRNPVFQKYYSDSQTFKEMAKKYISDHEDKEIEYKKASEKTIGSLSKIIIELKNALIQGLYHDGWSDESGNQKPIRHELGAPKWVISAFKAINSCEP